MIATFAERKATILALAMLFASGSALAQSTPAEPPARTQIWHQPPPRPGSDSSWLPQPILHTAGEVLEFTPESLRVDSGEPGASEAERRREDSLELIASERVVWIEPGWTTTSARQGMEAFEAGRYGESIPLLLEAVRDRPPVWQQQWLTGHMALAAAEAGRYPAALELIAQLSRSRPPTPMLCLLPIRWTARAADASAVAAARSQLDAAEPEVRLVAASWMLGSTGDRTAAERTLRELSSDDAHPWLARLADCVLWRRTAVPQIEAAAAGWLKKIDQLPISLQGGPLLCAADRLAAAGQGERARELALAAALLHRHPRPIAEEARAAAQLPSRSPSP
ncbi:tetratricopeptide repeat protein [Candidatus Laterigemmans baculatus]|uniref:tetratricopeptide repeat protein n=1 Tax=Candidatus Laterigemmans baculatus TaxID=2770505 RepID=UPI0013DBB0D2|nr:tetratricopeptide repeat protein [Candidatus Laterigemmans baculatus]